MLSATATCSSASSAAGGMATVYLARDLRHDRPVALKVLHQELAHALGPERFVQEIKVAARLQHPHILPVFDSGTAKQPGSAVESLWFTMPYVAGESLRQRLAREPQLPLRDAVRIALEVADALGYAHGQGLVHRDVKPENILLSGDHCVIADFGVARALDAAGGERLTETGITFGTPLYMSPEQASADRRLDGRSDIYSLGCVLYEMLAGDPPFTGRTAQAIIARRLSEPVPRLRTLRDVPESVEEVVAKALARSPADRFVDTSQFAQALQAAVGAQPAVPTEPARGGPPSSFQAAHPPGRGRRARRGRRPARPVPRPPARARSHARSEPPRHRPLRRARSLAAALARGAGGHPLPQPRRRRSAPDRVSDASPCGGGRVARTEPPPRPSVAAPERGWSCSAPWSRRGEDSVTLRAGVLDAVSEVRPEGGRGVGRVREDRRAGGLAGNPDPAGPGAESGDRVGAPGLDGVEVAAGAQGLPARRAVLPAGAMGLRPGSIRPGDRRRQHLRPRAGPDEPSSELAPADRGSVPARRGIRQALDAVQPRPVARGKAC